MNNLLPTTIVHGTPVRLVWSPPNQFGWIAEWDGKQYGDFLTYNDVNPSAFSDVATILLNQARAFLAQ